MQRLLSSGKALEKGPVTRATSLFWIETILLMIDTMQVSQS